MSREIRKGKLLVVSGFSGVGKGTVVKELVKRYSNYRVSVSATTRKPRSGEQDGTHYFFRSKKEFEDMIENRQLLEYADYLGNYYGTPKKFVDEQLDNGINVILEIETKGARQIKDKIADALLIFILPPDAETLKNRLVGRHTEPSEVISQRLMKAAEETESMDDYDYFVVNEDNKVKDCVENINRIITDNMPELIDRDRVQEIKKERLSAPESGANKRSM